MAALLFAEHLPYVGSTNLIVQLDSGLDSNTRLSITESGKCVVLQHHGKEETIKLHSAVSDHQHDSKLLPAPPSTTRLSRLSAVTRSRRSVSSTEHHKSPWTAGDLPSSSRFLCAGFTSGGKACHATILDGSAVKSYKDLPSEGWADMMDLWHCHKPEEDHDHSAANGKGYSASSKLAARDGVGFVDSLTILVAAEDCRNVNVLDDESKGVLCAQCDNLVGEVDSLSSGIRLFKPLLALGSTDAEATVSHDMSKWLSSYLLSLVDTSGIRKFQGRYKDFTIWIFSPLVYYSLSSRHGDPQAAVKIFYKNQLVQDRSQSAKLNTQTMQLDDLTLSHHLEAALADELGTANRILPDDARRFQDWNVAFLDRFPPERA
ncbi:hypothetical protein CAC42_5116 [Sphaceloma murrayae]|uniref:Uncharacterized protein n=1 Tax=Sphaceloma murrayae TaxID=2082308 RepID=A0A2K1QU25_9PEZI|nr:hypothetical protein CAC42_5116 [Sphaceloma murrayae]